MNDDQIDSELNDIGEALRGSVDPALVEGIVAGAAQRKVVALRRNNRILAVAAAVLAVAMVGSVAWAGTRNPGHKEVAGGPDLASPGVAAAEKLVASLPAMPVDPHKVKLVSTVSRYDTCDALAGQLRKVGAAHVGSQGFGGNYGVIPLSAPAYRDSAKSAAPDAAQAESLAFSDSGAAAGAGGETLGTNVIVEGVDEPDTVKAVTKLVVELSGNRLRIIDTTKSAVVSTLDMGTSAPNKGLYANPASLLVDGTRAVVFGNESVTPDAVEDDPSASRPPASYLTITFIDISNPSAPRVTQRIRIEGNLVAARRVGDSVRIVTSSSLNDLPMVAPMTANGVRPALHQNRLAVAESKVDDWIPVWDTGESTAATPLVGCSDVVVPDTFAGVEMTSLVQFDLAGPFAPEAMGILAPSEDLTATADAAVVASHVWVDPANQTGDYKDWSTALHRFSFDEAGPRYVGSGQVPGSIRDDFSLAVIDASTLGVVTVEGLPWAVDNSAKITVRALVSDPGATKLTEAGSLVPAGSSQGISALRFMGDRLLISSGLAGNRLSSVDLSTPTAPRDLGFLDLPGTGDYFHQVGDRRILVIGSTMKKVGKQFIAGAHATLVDSSQAPRIIGTWSQDNVSSNLGYDHHQFTWWASRSLAAFPAYSNAYMDSISKALFLQVGATDIVPRMITPREADLGPKCPMDQLDRKGCDDSGRPYVARVLVVDGAPWLYTSESVERLDPNSFASTNIVALPPTG